MHVCFKIKIYTYDYIYYNLNVMEYNVCLAPIFFPLKHSHFRAAVNSKYKKQNNKL